MEFARFLFLYRDRFSMIKKINVDRLIVGMYIHDINCSWLENPFIRKSFPVKDENMIAKIKSQNIREIYINTNRGANVKEPLKEAGTGEKAEGKKPEVITDDDGETKNIVPMKAEMENAKKKRKMLLNVTADLFNSLYAGAPIEAQKINDTVEGIVDSAYKNHYALTSLNMLKEKYKYHVTHAANVCSLTISFAKQLKVDSQTLHNIGVGALLLDIGKTMIPDEILNKEGKLTDEEFAKVKSHVADGLRILEDTKGIPDMAVKMVAEHHERIDGSGYPNALNNGQISRFGQIAGLIDSYDAISSDRSYGAALDPKQVLGMLYKDGRDKFDNELIQSFIRCVGVYPVGTLVRTQGGFLGIVSEPNEENMLKPVLQLVYNVTKDHFIRPRVLDLAATENAEDKIVGYEDGKKWNIDPLKYLDVF